MGNEVVIELKATDEASPTIQRVAAITQDQTRIMQDSSGSLDAYGRAVRSAANGLDSQGAAALRTAAHANALDRQWNKLTSGTEILASGIMHFRRVLEGILWSTIIGAVVAVVSKFIEFAVQSINTEDKINKLSTAVREQAKEWDLLPGKIKSATQSTVENYNANVAQAQFLERNHGAALQAEIKHLEQWNRELRLVLSAQLPYQVNTELVTAKILANNVALTQAKIDLEEWKKLMGLVPATLGQVQNNLAGTQKAAEELDRSILQQANDLALQIIKLQDGEAAYVAAIKGRLLVEGADIKTVDLLIQRMKDLRIQQLLAAQAPPPAPPTLPAVNLPTAAPPTAAEEAMLRWLDLLERYNILTKEAILGTEGLIVKGAVLGDITEQEMAQLLRHNAAMQFAAAGFQAAESALNQFILGQSALGPALKKATAAVLAATAARAFVEALYMTGIGIAALTPWGAATFGPAPIWFKAAAIEASIAAVAGGLGAALSSGSGGGGGGVSPAAVAPPAPSQAPQPINVTLYLTAGAVDQRTIDMLANQLVDSLGRVLEDKGGVAGNLQIETRRL